MSRFTIEEQQNGYRSYYVYSRRQRFRLHLFFHRTAVVGTEFDDLREGQEVSYKTEADPRDPSRFRATDVRVVTADNA